MKKSTLYYSRHISSPNSVFPKFNAVFYSNWLTGERSVTSILLHDLGEHWLKCMKGYFRHWLRLNKCAKFDTVSGKFFSPHGTTNELGKQTWLSRHSCLFVTVILNRPISMSIISVNFTIVASGLTPKPQARKEKCLSMTELLWVGLCSSKDSFKS